MSEPTPGPLAEEAAKLLEAITEWAGHLPGHGATVDGPECQLCPVCQALALLRRTQPDTFSHLADASASLIAAFRTVVERREPAESRSGSRRGGVERITLDRPDDLDGPGPVAEGMAR